MAAKTKIVKDMGKKPAAKSVGKVKPAVAPVAPVKGKVAPKMAPPEPTKKGKVVALTKSGRSAESGTITLADVARSLDPPMRPQTARARFRKKDEKELLAHGLLKGHGDRWTFKATARSWLEEQLEPAD